MGNKLACCCCKQQEQLPTVQTGDINCFDDCLDNTTCVCCVVIKKNNKKESITDIANEVINKSATQTPSQ